jgi:leucyl aminopeptidase
MGKRADGIPVKLAGAAPHRIEAALLAVPVHEEDLAGQGSALFRALDGALGGHLRTAVRAERFEGKADQALPLATLGKAAAARLLLLGLGPRAAGEGFGRTGQEPLRLAAGKAGRAGAKLDGGTLAVALPEDPAPGLADAARAAVEGALLGGYRFGRYRSEAGTEDAPGPSALVLAVPPGAERSREVSAAVELGRAVAGAVAWARDLVNLPPVDCTPAALADAARAMARAHGLAVEVRGPKEIEALKMGMFLAVTRGSAEPPRLVKVSWVPRGEAARRAPLVLVGKAITFDSGGLSLKPTEGMVTMHTDMAGSAAVLGTLRVVAALAPPFPVHAVLGACENMPGGRAYKPSDILTAYDGQTVEVTNTDAEGRLVLGDVLAWARDVLAPAAMVDVATLTGACVVALGPTTAGLFGPDGPAVDAVQVAARAAGEEVWRLPLVDSLREQVKGERADLKNTGDRAGGSISASHFLHAFAKDTPWAHLDIAGPSHATKERGYVPKGATGFGIRTLVELVRAWKPASVAAPAKRGRRAR